MSMELRANHQCLNIWIMSTGGDTLAAAGAQADLDLGAAQGGGPPVLCPALRQHDPEAHRQWRGSGQTSIALAMQTTR